ncbi:maltose ABC transporter substrate-binding protein [Thermosipho ferrireducens]|uniref:Maltose ABC transporter substrate-binding protein n=1 Tax=Thermosipho ferrireducens TaxID=2571116 RepID=A0ABX7S6X8_9BACT|nr:maltose ABC transporter substrate-binding protein [Thermosipho ferrireducens]QTA38329.1 maltose ABC transporter substrate-binding protein [Thermosipho ferrireducens]
MRKWLVVITAILMMLSVFAVKLTIWTSEAQVDILTKLADEFKASYGIDVEVVQVNFGDIKSKFLTAAPAGEGADIIVGAHDWVGELVANGLLEPIPILPDKDKYLPVPLKAFTFNGKLYGVPYAIDGPALIYNKDYVEEPPKTFDELIDLAKQINEEYEGEVRGFVYDYKNFYFSSYAFFGYGGYVFGEKGGKVNVKDIGLANEGAVKGLNLIKRLVDEGLLESGDNYNVMDGLFKDGQAAMIINGPWAVPGWREAGVDFAVAPIPQLEPGVDPKPFITAQGFMINAKSPNKLYAIEFLTKFIATKDVMFRIYQADPRIPSRSDVLALVDDKVTKDFADFLGTYGLPMPNVPEMAGVWGAMGDALAKALDQGIPVEQALKEAVDTILAGIK